MDITVGLNCFKSIVHKESLYKNNFEQWLPYYKEYQTVFDVLFEKLYMRQLDELQPHINALNFREMIRRAEYSLERHPVAEIEEVLSQCMIYFNMEIELEVFLLVGLDGIDGAAPISDKPFLFFGLERMNQSDINLLIPHEFNHLCRFHYLKDTEDMHKLTVKQLVVAEGLAVLTPLVMNNLPLISENMASALMITGKEYEALQMRSDLIASEVLADFDNHLSSELLAKYFMANEGADFPGKSGYFYGVMMITALIKKGHSLKELTFTKTDKIIALNNQIE